MTSTLPPAGQYSQSQVMAYCRTVTTTVVAVSLLLTIVTAPSLAARVDTTNHLGNSKPVAELASTPATDEKGSDSVAVESRGHASNLVDSRRLVAVEHSADQSSESVPQAASGTSELNFADISSDTRAEIPKVYRFGPDTTVQSPSTAASVAETTLATTSHDNPSASEQADGGVLRAPVPGQGEGILLASILLNGLLALVVLASRFDSRTLSRLARSVEALLPDRLGSDEAQTNSDEIEQAQRSDEEVVHHLLKRNGGQMRQSDIVDTTEWSKAKVSRLLEEMACAGDIVKIQLGRENLICLDGMEPEITKPLS